MLLREDDGDHVSVRHADVDRHFVVHEFTHHAGRPTEVGVHDGLHDAGEVRVSALLGDDTVVPLAPELLVGDDDGIESSAPQVLDQMVVRRLAGAVAGGQWLAERSVAPVGRRVRVEPRQRCPSRAKPGEELQEPLEEFHVASGGVNDGGP